MGRAPSRRTAGICLRRVQPPPLFPFLSFFHPPSLSRTHSHKGCSDYFAASLLPDRPLGFCSSIQWCPSPHSPPPTHTWRERGGARGGVRRGGVGRGGGRGEGQDYTESQHPTDSQTDTRTHRCTPIADVSTTCDIRLFNHVSNHAPVTRHPSPVTRRVSC
jgi:hypothetical protein